MTKRQAKCHRLKDKSGFTLTELLMTILILLMVTSVVAAGIPSAANAYYKVLDAANAQLLLSTTVTSLRRELALAREVELDPTDHTVSNYINGESGFRVKIVNTPTISLEYSTDGIIVGTTPEEPEDRPLVSQAAATSSLVTTFDSLEYADGIFTVNGLRVMKERGDRVLAGPITLRIYTIQNITVS